ncbi:GntR family transcriptional regulator [Aureimonas fodinaquatilis]|uniref:GntR family transcriptional regulator n=1 Tax=Aureimonas fodinaquatilis TaxID=2565783 RepID=A0A5B0E0M4_9HYPH|nr:GntR family transcriptional regulator [Aureimonas fodinaquatilis]KAA0972178.1 GntR family transcriptional regulator [Aureimonas fodinaquatilis]
MKRGSAPAQSLKLPNVLGAELSAIIERRIVYLEIPPGAHLTEQEVCDEFEISRSPVREAFRELEASGLVVRHARRGVRVTPMTEQHLQEIYFCRIPLEGMAAAEAAKLATEEDLERFQDFLKHMTAAMAAKDSKTFFDHNVAFITHIHSITGNRILTDILQIIEKQALRYRYFAHITSHLMLELSQNGLSEVYDGISSRRPGQAKQTTMRIMRDAQHLIAAALRENEIV